MSHGILLRRDVGLRLVREILQHLDARVQAVADRDVAAETPEVLDVALGRHHVRQELIHMWAVAFPSMECLS